MRVCCVQNCAKLQPRDGQVGATTRGFTLTSPTHSVRLAVPCPIRVTALPRLPYPRSSTAKKGVIRHPSETMAEAWDPVTGRNISEDELLSLIAAAGGATAMDEPCAMPDFSPSASPSDMLNVHLYNADGDCLGGLTSRDNTNAQVVSAAFCKMFHWAAA